MQRIGLKYHICGNAGSNSTCKLLYLLLSEMCDDDHCVVIPQRRIANVLQLSKGTISRNLRRLQAQGAIRIIAQRNDYGGCAPNKYIVL